MKIQTIALAISTSLALGFVSQAQAAESADAPRTDGFYGGVSYRNNAPGGMGVNFGAGGPGLSRTPTLLDESASRTLLFGGYRWQNDLSVEAAISSLDKYALRPLDTGSVQPGVGLRFGTGTGDVQSRSVNLDVFTSWTLYKSVALYGRLGYVQSESPQLLGISPAFAVANSRGVRDGMNYGVGMRYDMNQALGLRLEYSRFGRFAGEIGSSLPDTDQVTLGVQFKF